MSRAPVHVLLLGEHVTASLHLVWHLEERGCRCSLARSAEEGAALFQKCEFRLVLGMNSVQQTSRLISLLSMSNCSAFYALPVEQGCWWLPLMKGGQRCLVAAALRPREFTIILDETLKEIRGQYSITPKRPQEIVDDAYDNVEAFAAAS